MFGGIFSKFLQSFSQFWRKSFLQIFSISHILVQSFLIKPGRLHRATCAPARDVAAIDEHTLMWRYRSAQRFFENRKRFVQKFRIIAVQTLHNPVCKKSI